MKKLIVFLAIMLFSAGMVFADFGVIGFSPDGKYCAFTYSEFGNGEVFFQRTVRIVDVEANDFVDAELTDSISRDEARKGIEEEGATEYDAAYRVLGDKMDLRVSSLLKKYQISFDAQGEILYRNDLDLSIGTISQALKKRVLKAGFTVEKEDGLKKDYTLILEERKVPLYYDGQRMFTLKLSRKGKTKILQEDRQLPKSRQDPIAYSLSRVYYYNGMLAVILESVIGFDGINGRDYKIRPLIVTGDFKVKK